MAEITAAMVKALREETGQGMMECKKALAECNGDISAARDNLRKKGLVKAESKAARAISEGLIGILESPDRKSVVMVEVRCETDFCARNDVFRAMVAGIADMAMKMPAGKIEATQPIKDAVTGALAKIGENMSFARGVKIEAQRTGYYLHHNGKVGVLLGVEGETTDEVISDVCKHIAFADPMGINPSDIPAELVAKETAFAKEEAAASGKPANIIEKMVQGKVQKFLAEKSLTEQAFIRDDKKKVKDILGGAKVVAFARFAVGAD